MLQTPLEISGGTYTTHQEEADFYDALVADSDRISVESIGKSAVLDREMLFVSVGYPTAPAPGGTDSIYIVGTQHGSEPAGREAAIEYIRDLVYTTDPVMLNYLAEHPVFFLPTANPDRIGDFVRENLAGVNLNQDNLALTQGETKAIAEGWRRIQPTITVDLHETQNRPVSLPDLQSSPMTQWTINSALRGASTDLYDETFAYANTQGVTTDLYHAPISGFAMMLTHVAGYMNTLGHLLETDYGRYTLRQRIDFMLVALEGTRRHHVSAGADIQAVKASAAATAKAGPHDFPGYILTSAQHDEIAVHREAFSLITRPLGGSFVLPMRQANSVLIPHLVDADSPVRVISAERWAGSPPVIAESWGPLRLNSIDYDIASVELYQDGQLLPIWPQP